MTALLAPSSRTLRPHPQTPCAALEITGEIGIDEGRVLVVCYRIAGEIGRLAIPTEPLDPERLWAHTCCELFVAPAVGESYVEWNFSPNGQVARFEFSAYRRRRASSWSGVIPAPSMTLEPDALRLEARVPLPAEFGDAARISPTAVIEDTDGMLSYWALRHGTERPDFHHASGFALALTLGATPAIVDAPP